jgi:hypothetical protein
MQGAEICQPSPLPHHFPAVDTRENLRIVFIILSTITVTVTVTPTPTPTVHRTLPVQYYYHTIF